MKLHEIVAIQKSVKNRTYKAIEAIYKISKKSELFNGFSKKFQALNEDEDLVPDEDRKVQCFVEDGIKGIIKNAGEAYNTEMTLEAGNQQATADVMVDGRVLVKDAPIGFLFYLEKQFNDLQTTIKSFPTLDVSKDWTKDPNSNLFKTPSAKTLKKIRVQEPITLAPATKEHAAQVQLLPKDVVIGSFETIGHSGALPVPRKAELEERVAKMIEAVKTARARANSIQVERQECAAGIFGYLFE